MFIQVSTYSCRITVVVKSEGAMQCHRRGLTNIDPDATAMSSQNIAAQQAATQDSEVFGEEAAGMSKATVSVASVNIVES